MIKYNTSLREKISIYFIRFNTFEQAYSRAVYFENFFTLSELKMFAYDDLYSDKISGIEDARIVSISPLFNDKKMDLKF